MGAKIPVGSTLYSVYACESAGAHEMTPNTVGLEAGCADPVLLGDMVTTSECTSSNYGDSEFFIRHQLVENDWQLNPSLIQGGKTAVKGFDATAVCGCAWPGCSAPVKADGAPKKCPNYGHQTPEW